MGLVAVKTGFEEALYVNELRLEAGSRKRLLDAPRAQRIPMIIVRTTDDVLVAFVHAEKPDAKGLGCDAAKLVQGEFHCWQGEMLEKIVDQGAIERSVRKIGTQNIPHDKHGIGEHFLRVDYVLLAEIETRVIHESRQPKRLKETIIVG